MVLLDEGRFIWSSDGSALLYDHRVAGVSNVWSMPISGGEPEQLTHFDGADNDIGGITTSPDCKTLVVGVGRISQDIVLLENFRWLGSSVHSSNPRWFLRVGRQASV